jgi:hypothetical protein
MARIRMAISLSAGALLLNGCESTTAPASPSAPLQHINSRVGEAFGINVDGEVKSCSSSSFQILLVMCQRDDDVVGVGCIDVGTAFVYYTYLNRKNVLKEENETVHCHEQGAGG